MHHFHNQNTFFFFFLAALGFELGLALARQALYHLSQSISPSIFNIRESTLF
jgi:arylamine N-acetyltransferase